MAHVKNGVSGPASKEAKVNGAPASSAISSPVSYTTQRSSYSFRKVSSSTSFSGDSNITGLLESTAHALEKRSTVELGYGVFENISHTSFVNLVQFIGTERLSSLPHKGSKWDKVLMRSLYFAEQQHGFEKMVKSFGTQDTSAVSLGYGYAKLLLELGHENAAALDKAFAILYKHSLEVSALLRRTELVSTTPQIREQLCLMYGDLLSLTAAVATRYYKAVHGMASTKVSLDIYEIAGNVLESFRDRQAKVAEMIWSRQAQLESFDISEHTSVKALKQWLTPSDHVISTLSEDHMASLSGQAEFTCIWFQKPLTSFVQGPNKVMAVTGQSGSGKSVLAASIAERLQRPLGRQTYSSLFYSIRGTIPSAATPINVLKSLLSQIFRIRVGNMQTYHAVARAYRECMSCPSLKEYENHLWSAVEEALKKPLEHGHDLVIVVDGIDELHGGKPVAQAFFERLADIVSDGNRVKLVGLGHGLSLPAGMDTTHIDMSPDVLHDDIHAVILKNLVSNRSFTSKQGPEQDHLLERLVKASHGSFVWATLVSQLLHDQKSADELTKAVDTFESSKPSIQDLVQRNVTKQELSATTKLILAWIIAAERPLAIREIRTLLSSGLQSTSAPDQEIDVHSTLRSLESVLLFNEGIVRFKHPSIQHIVGTLVDTGKITVPVETRHGDLLIRLLNYARKYLREEPDPTFDDYELDALERHFREAPLLRYVVRFWTTHMHHVHSKPPQDLSKVLPSTSIMPQLERTFWALELPLAQTIELHKIAYSTRQTNLPELSAATLQSTLNTAIVYEHLGRPNDAAPLFFTCTKVSRNLLSNYHPLPIECGYRYLATTETSITTTRTEVMTRREEILKILITLSERQYGKQSSQVIEVRTMLAQLYEHIHEEERAAEVWQSIRETTVSVYGKDSVQARDISDQLNVVLGKSSTKKVETRTDSIFDEEEEEYIQEDLDIATIGGLIASCKSERSYVELWQRISSICRTTTAAEWHEKNIEVSLAYAKYLRSEKRTEESSAIVSSVAREYESNQASYSEKVVLKLQETASFMREIGQFSACLSVLKMTSSFYQSMKREESSQYTETQRMISTLMTEMVQKDTSETHSHLLEDVYRRAITDHSRTVDTKLLVIGRKLVVQYLEEAKPGISIDLIKLTLHRIWPAFHHRSANDIEMTTTFSKESVDFVELLVDAYSRQREFDLVERTLTKLFNAFLTTKTIDFAHLKKIETQLLKRYDDNNYPEKSITILQKLLPIQRTHLGSTHEDTIKTLYELGRRSRERERSYPFWIEYYQQIVTNLNKDSDTCHPTAMDALILVVTSYWEDRRYPEAISSFSVLWKTFVNKPKDYQQFSRTEFAEKLYERYYYCLEQTGARFDTLYQITKQYRQTCITIFGAQSTIAAQATLTLARICHASETRSDEALGWYEEASHMPAPHSHSKGEISSALSYFYTREVITQKSTKTETIQRAVTQTSESYSKYVAKYGYSHESSLSQLSQLAVMYKKLNKTESATKELTIASREIITKETSSTRMIEAAETIFAAFAASSTIDYCSKLVSEIYRQLITKDCSSASTWGFDLSKHGRGCLPFLAAMEYRLHSHKHVSFSQLMAELTLEMSYYEDYRKLVKSNADLQSIIISASTLRRFLVKTGRTETIAHLDHEVGQIFVTRDGSRLKLKSKASGQIFMVAIMQYLGTYKTASFAKAVILASNDSLETLMAKEQYAEAYDIAGCAFAFAIDYEGYGGAKGISHGFNLAFLLAGIGLPKKCSDATLHKQMLHLSNEIVKKVLEICKKQEIDFAQVQLRDLNRLVLLLGEQEDYVTLEWLLTTLWHSRSAQRTWSATTLHNLRRLLICARYLANHPIQALRLCEDIAYNLRRTHGASHPATTDMNLLLAQLYTSSGYYYLQNANKDKHLHELANSYFSKALNVHEEMLRLLVNDVTDGGVPGIDDDEDLDTTGAILAEHGILLDLAGHDLDVDSMRINQGKMAATHLRLLRLAHQRLGQWPKPYAQYENLIKSAQTTFGEQTKDVPSADKWQTKGFGNGKAETNDGAFDKVHDWTLVAA